MENGLAENRQAIALAMMELYDGYSANRSLLWTVGRMSEIIKKPLAVVDAQNKVLAATEYAERLLRDESASGALAEYHEIKIDTLEIARLVIWSEDGEKGESDGVFTEKFCALLSSHLQRAILLNDDYERLPSYLLADLIEGRPINEALLNNRQRFLRASLTENLYIMVAAGSGNDSFDNKLATTYQALKKFVPIERCIIHKSAYIAFLDQPLFVALFPGQPSGFTDFLQKMDMFAGVSLPFNNLTHSRRQYKNALKALEIGRKRGSNHTHFADCALLVIHEMIAERYDVMDLCHPAVKALLNHDRERGTDLVATLKQYLYFASAPDKAAQNLNIHRNTLFYRIGKIKEYTGVTFESGEEICKLYLSIRTLEENGLLKK